MTTLALRTSIRGIGSPGGHQELARYIQGHVDRAAGGRIRDLEVECTDDRILLRGRSRTYHAKQIAQQAVLDLTDGHPLLANQIVVS